MIEFEDKELSNWQDENQIIIEDRCRFIEQLERAEIKAKIRRLKKKLDTISQIKIKPKSRREDRALPEGNPSARRPTVERAAIGD